jgi:glycosyltransferase involved in cell wall biosynthesis
LSEIASRPQVSFVVPCYNEAANIEPTIAAIEAGVTQAGVPSHEIVIIDDASIDKTQDVAAGLADRNSAISLIVNPVNKGFGGAYKEGLSRARGRYVIMVPGDDAFPVDSITRILEKRGEADIVVPYFERSADRSFLRRVISRLYTHMMNVIFRLHLPYYNGPVLHRADLLKTIEIETDGFGFQAEGLIKLIKAGATYTTVGIKVRERQSGRSTALRPKNIYRVAKMLPELWLEVRRHRLAHGGEIGSSCVRQHGTKNFEN